MARKKKTTIEEYAPTLNGHPILTVSDVTAWFTERKCDVREDLALEIAERVNQYEFLGAFWKDTPELRKQRRNNPALLRNIRVATALRTLQNDLRLIIEDNLKVIPSDQSERLRPFYDLLSHVDSIAPLFDSIKIPGRGRTPAGWHIVARKVGTLIAEASRQSTGRRIGLGKPTSPAVAITQKALDYMGVKAKPEAIVDAVRPSRVRSPKRLGK